MADYKCLHCGENFPSKSTCAIHHFHTSHEEYELEATDIKITIKTPEN